MFKRRRRVWVAVVLGLGALVWLLANGPVEGRTLLEIAPDHGLTEADLPGLAMLGVSGALLLTALR